MASECAVWAGIVVLAIGRSLEGCHEPLPAGPEDLVAYGERGDEEEMYEGPGVGKRCRRMFQVPQAQEPGYSWLRLEDRRCTTEKGPWAVRAKGWVMEAQHPHPPCPRCDMWQRPIGGYLIPVSLMVKVRCVWGTGCVRTTINWDSVVISVPNVVMHSQARVLGLNCKQQFGLRLADESDLGSPLLSWYTQLLT